MRNFRITPLIVGIIGAILCIAAPAIIYFTLIQQVQADIATQQAALQPVQQYVDDPNPPELQAAQKLLLANQAQANVIKSQWATLYRAKNPLIESSDKWRAWYEWIAFLEFEFAPRINRFLYSGKAQPLTTIAPVDPPNSPDQVPTNIIQMPLGTISVFGSYNQILQQVESWNNFNRIVEVDGLSLQGYSPFMTGTYTATMYIYPEAATGLSPAAGAPPSAPTAPGAPGGGGGAGTATPLPPPPSTPTNFEDVPEYRVHITNPKPLTTQTAAPFGARR